MLGRSKPLIVMNIKKSVDYDETVDLDSMLPVYIAPILVKGEEARVVGVVEVPMKQRFHIKSAKDDIFLGSSALVGVDESVQLVADKLCSSLGAALSVLKFI